MKKTVYFIRHGEAEANAQGVLAGTRNDTPLTDRGRAQAKDAAELVAKLPIEVMIVSPLSRAQETAHIIADAIGYKGRMVTEPMFAERDFGSATALPLEEALKLLDDGTAEELEQVPEFHARANEALAYLRNRPEEHMLVVSHGGFARMVGDVVTGLRPEDFLQHPKLGNAEIYEFSLE